MTAPARLCVTRHGETDWNAAGILQGWLNVILNERGRQQSRELAAAFATAGFTRLYTSPLVRSRESADIIGGALGLLPAIQHDGLKERHFGMIQGIPKDELAAFNPALLREIIRRNPACVFDGGESMEAFARRVEDAIVDIGNRESGERVLIITHGWVMDVINRVVRGLPVSTILHAKPKNGESIWLDVVDGKIVGAPS